MELPRVYLDGRLEVDVGDVTKEMVDAIVNAANSSLMGGGGVDGAIHRAGGPAVLEACKAVRASKYPDGLPTGEAVITTGGRLHPRVIHTVGPIYRSSKDTEAKLASCYRRSLEVALENGCRTVAFPAISTGVYGYPKPEAARVASRAIVGFLEDGPCMEKVRLVFFSKADAVAFIENCDLPY